ncbi:MAG: NAD(P)-dependent alcohol dehydrogenase [Polyangiales bacterium]
MEPHDVMRCATYSFYGGPELLEVSDWRRPHVQREGEVRVNVHAAALNPKDILVRKGKMRMYYGELRRQRHARFVRIPGYDFAGVVDESRSSRFKVGERVFGMVNGWDGGTCAEYVCVSDDELTHAPERPMSELAAMPLVSLTALQALRDQTQLQVGEHVVINGASGGLGTVAIQVARIMGAEVSAVCSKTNEDFVRGLGAHHVLPYDEEALVRRDLSFDVVCDFFGTAPYSKAKTLLRRGGRYVTALPSPGAVARELLSRAGLSRARLVVVRSKRKDLDVIASWMDGGKLRPLIDSSFDLDEQPDAHRRVESRRARGKVIVDVRSYIERVAG